MDDGWRDGLGAYAADGEAFERAVIESRRRTSAGLAARRNRVLEELAADAARQ